MDAEARRQDDLRAAEGRRQDDLRLQAERWQEKLDKERLRADGEMKRADAEAKHAESSRIDALNAANKNDVALALEKQGAQATAQDKRIAVLEQNQYQAGGKDIQRTEGRQERGSNDRMLLAIAVAILSVVFFAANYLKPAATPTAPVPVTITVVAPTPTPTR